MSNLIMIAALVYVSCAYLALVTFELLPGLSRISISDSDRNVALVLSALWPLAAVVFVITSLIQAVDWSVCRIRRAWGCEK